MNKLFSHPSGIYQIRNIVNGNIYIGQSSRIVDRRYTHFYLLRKNKSHNSHLQSAYNKYGENSFAFEVLLYCDVNDLDYFEQLFVDELKPQYNFRDDVTSNRGRKVSDETRKKLSEANKGRIISESQRRKIGDAHRGKCFFTDEQRKKQSERMLGHKINVGKVKSKETLQKLSNSLKESWKNRSKTFSQDVRDKFSVAHLLSPKTKRGENNPKSKLTNEKVIEIRKLHIEQKYSFYHISKIYQLDPSTVADICKYKTWKHVP